MATTQQIIDTLIEGLQDKKGRNICTVDLSRFDSAPARAFVICTGGSPGHVDALADSAENFCRERLDERPAAVAGKTSSMWVAMDFGDVILHIFLPAERDYYDLEHLWDDAEVKHIEDLD